MCSCARARACVRACMYVNRAMYLALVQCFRQFEVDVSWTSTKLQKNTAPCIVPDVHAHDRTCYDTTWRPTLVCCDTTWRPTLVCCDTTWRPTLVCCDTTWRPTLVCCDTTWRPTLVCCDTTWRPTLILATQ